MNEANNSDKKRSGYVFNIQHYSVHDGPGIRTLVFLKGCPLKCKWCSNPESQKPHPELAHNTNRCIGTNECEMCIEVCNKQAIKGRDDSRIDIDRELCNNCFKCADVCPSKALRIYGDLMRVDEVLEHVEKDSAFYSRSSGGLTVSGGEPLLQADFTTELLKEAKRRRINTSIETCGYADWGNLSKVCENLNTIFYDIKCLDADKHKKFTSVSNEKIKGNFKMLCKDFPELSKTVRTPVIPGFNDSEEDIMAIIDFIKGMPNVNYELLPYHRLGQPKYEYLGREYPLSDVKLSDEKMKVLKEIVKSRFY